MPLSSGGSQPVPSALRRRFALPNGLVELTARVHGLQYKGSCPERRGQRWIRGLLSERSSPAIFPIKCILKGKDAIAQFVTLCKTWDYSSFDVGCEVSANRKTIFLNWLFWSSNDFSEFGISEEQRRIMLERLQECWTFNHIDIPLPGASARY